MKKRHISTAFLCLFVLSICSFVFLNKENPDFALFTFPTELPTFNVAPSHLPDVEAVKNTILLIKEIILFDL
jgi:hypothetical protein